MLANLRYKMKNLVYHLASMRVPHPRSDANAAVQAGFKSQCGQDQFVAERLGFLRNGVFVDIGANDGVTLSNSYYFEKELGWTGVAVEPLRSAYEKLASSRSCDLVHGCVSDVAGEVEFLECDSMNGMLSGIASKMDSKQLRTLERTRLAQNGIKQMTQVESVTPERLLADHGITRIDYLSIDTEGGELDILRSFDFDKVFVRVISVENNHYSLAFRKYMRSCGFRLVAILDHDEIFENTRAENAAVSPGILQRRQAA